MTLICRIGSLEKKARIHKGFKGLICRIGSLEMHMVPSLGNPRLICRIGSLENISALCYAVLFPYLPHRQLRKAGPLP